MIDGAIGGLDTPRLELEPLRVEHAAEMVGVLADRGLYRFTGGDPPSLETLVDRYRSQVMGSGHGNELWLNWIIRHATSGAAVGFVQATVELDAGPAADLAWFIGTDHQGQGFAVEATSAVAEWLTANGVPRLTAHIHPGHEASRSVAGGVGLADTGALDDDGESIWTSASTMPVTALPATDRRSSSPSSDGGLVGSALIGDVDPHRRDVAVRIVEIQRAAYAIEAELIGFAGIPPLHETADDVAAHSHLAWLGSYAGDTLVGVIAWENSAEMFDIDRLAIHPDWSRQGRGRALVNAVLDRAGPATVTVSTGARNLPAVLLYRDLGFRPVGRTQIAPGVFTDRFERAAGSD